MHLRFGYIAVYHHHTYAKHVDASLYFVQTNEFSAPSQLYTQQLEHFQPPSPILLSQVYHNDPFLND